jgi:hypothetical protein
MSSVKSDVWARPKFVTLPGWRGTVSSWSGRSRWAGGSPLNFVHAVRAAARDLYDEFGVDASYGWMADEGSVIRAAARLASFGAVSGDDVLADGCAVTPLGRWAAERLRAALAGPGEDLTAVELIGYLAECGEDDRDERAWDWLDAQPDPVDAARRLLQAGASMEPQLRWIAADVVELLGKDALPAWRQMTGVPGIGPHAKYALYQMDAAPEPGDAEWLWLAVESAALALAEKGPDEGCGARQRPPVGWTARAADS